MAIKKKTTTAPVEPTETQTTEAVETSTFDFLIGCDADGKEVYVEEYTTEFIVRGKSFTGKSEAIIYAQSLINF